MQGAVIFTHIPKVAGTSLRRQLVCENVPGDRMKRYRGIRDLAQAKSDAFDVLYDHPPYGVHRLIQRRCHYFTMLREPVERAISHYFFFQQDDSDPTDPVNEAMRTAHQTIALKDMFATMHARRWRLGGYWLMDNLQTRFLAGIPHFWRGRASSTLLQAAKLNLRTKFAAFGLQERYEQSVSVIADQFDWRVGPPLKKRLKATSIEKAIDEETRAVVTQNHELDLELYAYAKELFESRYGRAA